MCCAVLPPERLKAEALCPHHPQVAGVPSRVRRKPDGAEPAADHQQRTQPGVHHHDSSVKPLLTAPDKPEAFASFHMLWLVLLAKQQ